MPGGRKPGRQEAKKRPTELQERDFTIFSMLRKARVLRTKDFVPLIFEKESVARRRLLKLVGSRYLAAYAPSLNEETRYMLDRQGQRALVDFEEGDVVLRSCPTNWTGPGAHHLTLVRFWAHVVTECERTEGLRLIRFSFEWEVTIGHLPTTTRFRPDAVFVVQDRSGRRTYLIELDRDTESTGDVKVKFETFARIWASGTQVYGEVPTGLLLVTSSQRRLRALVRSGGFGQAPVFGCLFEGADFVPVLSSGWHRFKDLAEGRVLAGAVVDLG